MLETVGFGAKVRYAELFPKLDESVSVAWQCLRPLIGNIVVRADGYRLEVGESDFMFFSIQALNWRAPVQYFSEPC